MKVFSFDLFDTVIARKVATPTGIYCMLQAMLRDQYGARLTPHFIEEFVQIRIDAENNARREAQAEEITLCEIYEQMAVRCPSTDRITLEKIRIQETEIELKYSYGIAENVLKIKRLLAQGERVVFISDMYLPKEIIRRMLESIDSDLAAIQIYLSSECRKTKSGRGNLYRQAMLQEQITPNQLYHFGDNLNSDVVIPRRLSINAEHYGGARLSDLEQNVFFDERNLFAQICVGAIKHARLATTEPSAEYLVGASLTAPLMYGFVHEVIKRVTEKEGQRLYYLARDGRVLKLIGDIIVKQFSYPIDNRYLFGSRQAFHLSSVTELSQRDAVWLQGNWMRVRFSDFAKRIGLSAIELDELLPSHLKVADSDRFLYRREIKRLIDVVISDCNIGKKVCALAEIRRKEAIKYLRQEGLCDASRHHLIDVGWHGNMQYSIYRMLLSECPDTKLDEYYFGVLSVPPGISNRNRMIPICVFPNSRYSGDLAIFIEALCQADHGSTSGYTTNVEGSVAPILNSVDSGMHRWKIHDYYKGIVLFSRCFAEVSSDFQQCFDQFYTIQNVLIESLYMPNRVIADGLGRVPYSGDQTDCLIKEIAPVFTVSDAFRYVFTARVSKRLSLTHWLAVTSARSSFLVRLILLFDPMPCLKRISSVLGRIPRK